MEQDVPRRVSLKESDFLNTLRGFAIIGVVAMHSMQVTDSLGQKHVSVFVSEIVQLGKYGVEVFFFLSGWLLAALYGINKEPLPRSYAVRRSAKIFHFGFFSCLCTLCRGIWPIPAVFNWP